MTDYEDREAICLWHELKYVYPELAPDGRTEEEKRLQAEQDIVDLFGSEEEESEEENADQGTD